MAAGTLVYEAGALVPQADVLVAVVAADDPYLGLDFQDLIDAAHWAFGWSGDAINPSRGFLDLGLPPAPDFEVRAAAQLVRTINVGLYQVTVAGEPVGVTADVALLYKDTNAGVHEFDLDAAGAVVKPVNVPSTVQELRLVSLGGGFQVLDGEVLLGEITAAELAGTEFEWHEMRPYALSATDRVQADGAFNVVDSLSAFWWNGTSGGGPSEFWTDFLLAREEV